MPSIPNQIQGDTYINGNLSARGLTVPANAIGNNQVQGGAPGAYISAEKLGQQVRKSYAQTNVTASSETRPIYIAFGAAGTVLAFSAASIAVAVGAATVTIDLKKNGASILSAPIQLDNSSVARVAVAGAISAGAYVAGDFFEVVIVATAGGGTIPTGLVCEMVADEDPQ